MGWAAGRGILGPGDRVPGVVLEDTVSAFLADLALAALMTAVRTAFLLIAAVGLWMVRV